MGIPILPEEIKNLQPGTKVYFSGDLAERHAEAIAEVIEVVGDKANIQIQGVILQPQSYDLEVGAVFLADWWELRLWPK